MFVAKSTALLWNGAAAAASTSVWGTTSRRLLLPALSTVLWHQGGVGRRHLAAAVAPSGGGGTTKKSSTGRGKRLRFSMRVIKEIGNRELESPLMQKPFPNNEYFHRYNFLGEEARDFVWTLFLENREKWTPKILSLSLDVPQDEIIAYVQHRVIEEQYKAHGIELDLEGQKWIDFKLTARPVEFTKHASEAIVERYRQYQEEKAAAAAATATNSNATTTEDTSESTETSTTANTTEGDAEGETKKAEDPKDPLPQYISVNSMSKRKVPEDAITILDENERAGNKRNIKFIFTETYGKERRVWVRDPNGVLRTATKEENQQMALPDFTRKTIFQRALGIDKLPPRSESAIQVPAQDPKLLEKAVPWPKTFFEVPINVLNAIKSRQTRLARKRAEKSGEAPPTTEEPSS